MLYKQLQRVTILFTSFYIFFLFGLQPSIAASQNELKGVKNEISRQKKGLTDQQQQLDKLQNSLKQQELSIAQITKKINTTKKQLITSNSNVSNIDIKITKLNNQKKIQTKHLEQLLQTYYVTQRAKASSNMLSNGIEKDRISQYYQHLAKSRSTTISQLEKTSLELKSSQSQLSNEQKKIASLLNQQIAQRNDLSKTQSKRKNTVGNIRQKISGNKDYLTELQRNETRLKAEIAKAAKRNSIPMDGLAKQRNKLPWPLKGKVLHSYGTSQTGQINWKGIVINADYGQKVKSVYSGTVVFAEYLRGYGLVILLDHGKGDMTLYGFNQALVKKEGDKVTAGETIALAGDTGGQTRPSLYFEIRRNSRTQNPRKWLVYY